MDGQKIQEFKAVTDCKDDDRALFYLKSAGNDVGRAISRFFDEPDLYKAPPKKYERKQRSVGGHGSLREIIGQTDEEDKKRQPLFAGGGDKSGTAIFGQDEEVDPMKTLFGKAKDDARKRQQGGGKEDKKPEPKVSHWDQLGASGNKLGHTDVPKPKPATQQPGGLPVGFPRGYPGFGGMEPRGGGRKETDRKPAPKDVTLKLVRYKNGFTFGESDKDPTLLSYDVQKNKLLLKRLNDGYVPNEFNPSGAKNVNVELHDRSRDVWKPPPKVFKAFVGGGNTLGASGGGGRREYKPVMQPKVNVENPPPRVKPRVTTPSHSCDLGKPHTTIAVKFADGMRMRIKFNLDDTIETIKKVVSMSAREKREFNLVMPYPRKVLTNLTLTIKEAGLEQSQLQQVWK